MGRGLPRLTRNSFLKSNSEALTWSQPHQKSTEERFRQNKQHTEKPAGKSLMYWGKSKRTNVAEAQWAKQGQTMQVTWKKAEFGFYWKCNKEALKSLNTRFKHKVTTANSFFRRSLWLLMKEQKGGKQQRNLEDQLRDYCSTLDKK